MFANETQQSAVKLAVSNEIIRLESVAWNYRASPIPELLAQIESLKEFYRSCGADREGVVDVKVA